MNIIDATWEIRNLGVKTVELSLEKNDTVDYINKTIDEIEKQYEYIVVKCHPGEIEQYSTLMQHRYCFIETMVHLNTVTTPLSLINDNENIVLTNKLSSENKGKILKSIEGGLYNSDRVSKDSYFTKEQANRRFINWINDEIQKGATIYSLLLDKELLGFTITKNIDKNVSQDILRGIFPEYQGKGYSIICTSRLIDEERKKGIKNIVASISTNNMPSLVPWLKAGGNIREFENIFVKHNELKIG